MDKRFKCPQCEAQYSKKTNLTRHLRAVHNASAAQRRYGCDECAERFSTLRELRGHYVGEHAFQPAYENHFFRSMAGEGLLLPRRRCFHSPAGKHRALSVVTLGAHSSDLPGNEI